MPTYKIKLKDGTEADQEGQVVKYGSGKRTLPAIGISKGEYRLTHIPSGLSLTGSYEYASQAKVVAQSIVEELGECLLNPNISEEAFSPELQMYMRQQWGSLKTIPNFTEWRNEPDNQFTGFSSTTSDSQLPLGETAEDARRLQAWNRTLAWVPGNEWDIASEQLERFIEGRSE